MGDESIQVFLGRVVHCEHPDQPDKLSVLDDGLVVVRGGKVVRCEPLAGRSPESVQSELEAAAPGVEVLCQRLGACDLLIPGLVDAHVHAAQVPNAGLGYDRQLLDWLQTYTFPLEARFRDEALAEAVYKDVVNRTLSAGTTLACYFATVHVPGSVQLARSAARAGQRALVGKVCMNVNAPPDLAETRAQSLSDSKTFVRAVRELQTPLVQPVLTPRFAVSCDMELMTDLAELARQENLHIQTHVSENKREIETVLDMYSESNYCAVYDRAGLLTGKTVLAHGVFLTDAELELLAARGTSLAHCPASNTCLQSGLCDVRRLLRAGLAVGLGSDVSGGPSLCILDAVRSAMDASVHVSFSKDSSYTPISYREAFFLATLGGARALAMQDVVGNLAVGKEFDALVVRVPSEAAGVPGGPGGAPLDTLQLLQKFLYCGCKEDILQVFVRGRLVKSRPSDLTLKESDVS